jgi:hypothetical protein
MHFSSTKIADVLERAADLYESGQYELHRGSFFNNDQEAPGVCAIGALMLAAGSSLVTGRLLHNLQTTILYWDATEVVERKITGYLLPTWNDAPGRTKQEVIDLFKETAKELRNAEEPAGKNDITA